MYYFLCSPAEIGEPGPGIPDSMNNVPLDDTMKGYMRTALAQGVAAMEMSTRMLTRYGIPIPASIPPVIETMKNIDVDTMTYGKMKELQNQMKEMATTLQQEMMKYMQRPN